MEKAQNLIISAIVLAVFLIIAIQLFASQFMSMFGTEDTFEELQTASSNIGTSLLTEAVPNVWNESSIKRVGLVVKGVIDVDSLARYANLSYSRTKLLLGMKRDYLFFFTNGSKDIVRIRIGDIVMEYWGWNGKEKPNGGSNFNEVFDFIAAYSENIAKDERFVRLKIGDDIDEVTLVTYVWDFSRGSTVPIPWLIEYYDFWGYLETTKPIYSTGETIDLTGVI